MKMLLIISAIFYGVLCIFSIVTGSIYMSGKKELNPLELSDKFVSKLKEKDKLSEFAKIMGLVTFIVGIIQGLTSYSIFVDRYYALSIGFTIFSILSVAFKLKSKKANNFFKYLCVNGDFNTYCLTALSFPVFFFNLST